MFESSDPAGLAAGLKELARKWPTLEIDLEGCQERIRSGLLVDQAVEKMDVDYRGLLEG